MSLTYDGGLSFQRCNSECHFPVRLRGDPGKCEHKLIPLFDNGICRCSVCEICANARVEEVEEGSSEYRISLIPPGEELNEAIKAFTGKRDKPVLKSRYDIAKE